MQRMRAGAVRALGSLAGRSTAQSMQTKTISSTSLRQRYFSSFSSPMSRLSTFGAVNSMAPRGLMAVPTLWTSPMPMAGTKLGLVAWEQTRGMRHRQKKNKLNRPYDRRMAMLRNMATDLIMYERIKTTVARAKALRRVADRMVTLAKQGTLMARRQLGGFLRTGESISKLFLDLVPRYAQRHGGYTRIVRCIAPRKGDNADMAWIEYIDREGELRPCKPAATRLPYSKMIKVAETANDQHLVDYYKKLQEQVDLEGKKIVVKDLRLIKERRKQRAEEKKNQVEAVPSQG
ncbi:hypothetical protein GUITHDRAFT_158129 [Guillardia theta CCMP2712]|uniref:Uncharacterized protein n=2 Tax=Guillardia theta TaxID=55529 RepID=L1J232_GUITC|nr:hypothetical protein GUITHDRAFT_158129 [Guillardia theta CCMP2712]EKX42581.1 hypothetical protein GUITHDRAFT_158129 [Guillardia theta CCMP2712]|eukprot:XP_005829561.1 hypothetical protein GUITHDRAFT_158129 [Guillardia theta CCMP2712]